MKLSRNVSMDGRNVGSDVFKVEWTTLKTTRPNSYCGRRKFFFYLKSSRIYRAVLPVVLYECEIWSLTLREEHRLRVFENRVPRRIFGPKRDEVTGRWRKLHNEELHNLYSFPSIIRMIKSKRMR
jgi:hypothetical protein